MSSQQVNPETATAGAAFSRSSTALRILTGLALGALLYFAHAAFIPVALALLLALILSGPVEYLHRKRIPRSFSATLFLVLVLSIFAGIGMRMWKPAQGWFANAPQNLSIVRQKVRPVAKFMNHLDDLRKNASVISAPGQAASGTPNAAPVTATVPVPIVDATGSAAAATLTFVIVTVFLLTGGPPMMARMGAAFADNLHSSHVLKLIDKVRAEVGHFYLTTALINLGLGVATGIVMWAWGLPTPFLWGAMAAVLNFIPYAGSATTLLVLWLVAIVSFNTLGQVWGVAGSYVALATIEGQVVQPLLVGRRLQVNPLLIFLGLWFGGLFWGVAGVILATPTLVTLKVIAENSKSGKPMLEFLGPNNQKTARIAKR
jgi:predicted PurR-regulated permease PerM